MAQDKELEIRLQFLEEAQDYLNTIESGMLGLSATGQIDRQRMDAVLRAAHSIKGGAAMMGFVTLSHLAHRLEDSFKVLKIQQPAIDAELESLLLAGVDGLRQVIAINSKEPTVDEQWLEIHVNPVLEQLYQRLGEPQGEDASLLLPEDGQDNMMVLLFETEVEGCLQRLEAVVAHPEQPCLLEEISIMAQELGGLGEMLQLNAFTSLCESITQHLEATPDRLEEITHVALQQWRRSQAAVLIGQLDTLPTQIDLVPAQATSPDAETAVPYLPTDQIEELWNSVQDDILTPELDIPELPAPVLVMPVARNQSEQTAEPKTNRPPVLSEYKSEFAASDEPKDHQENTVRVPIKQLDQLNDLFGELTIERNGLDLHLRRLRNLVQLLSRRVRTLQQSNTRLRTAYDKVATTTGNPLPHSDNGTTHPQDTSPYGFDSLEMDRYGDLDQLSQQVMETIVQLQEVTDDIDLSLGDTNQTVSHLNRTAKQLQNTLTQARMRPLSDLVGRFPRALRDLSLQYGKNVELKVSGGGTLIDRTILEALSDPLMHLLRNAFDHGIEDPETRQARGKPAHGTIEIRAGYRGNQTLITVRDDGGGINLDKIQVQAQHLGLDADLLAAASDEELLSLIFEPGFSTAGQVTALSGRGVGMDVVRTNLRQVRGDIKVDTQLGVGTTFTLSVPFTLSVARVLLVESNGMPLAFPTDVVEEMLLLKPEQIFTIADNEVLSWQDYMVPLIRLSNWLQFRCPRRGSDSEAMPVMSTPTVLMIAQGNELVALQVDRCWGEQEVAIRQVEGNIAMPSGFTGCTILGDGRVVPLVNAPDLLRWIASSKPVPSTKPVDNPPITEVPLSQKNTILVVDDSINVRRFLTLTLEKAGYRVEQAKDGQDGIEKLLGGLQVQAVICDIDMPRLDGFGLLARIKSDPVFDQLPIAMLTSRSGEKHRKLAMNLGATAYFSKPYNEQELLQTLRQLI